MKRKVRRWLRIALCIGVPLAALCVFVWAMLDPYDTLGLNNALTGWKGGVRNRISREIRRERTEKAARLEQQIREGHGGPDVLVDLAWAYFCLGDEACAPDALELTACEFELVDVVDPLGGPRVENVALISYLVSAPAPAGAGTGEGQSSQRHPQEVPQMATMSHRLAEKAASGKIGSASPRFYGAMTDYSQGKTSQKSAPHHKLLQQR